MKNNAYGATMVVWKGAGDQPVPSQRCDFFQEGIRLIGNNIDDGLLGDGTMDDLCSSFLFLLDDHIFCSEYALLLCGNNWLKTSEEW